MNGKCGKQQITGTLWLSVGDLPGVCPEMSVMMSHPQRLSSLILAPRVQITLQSDNTTKLTCSPTPHSRVALCHYTTSCELLPIQGILSVNVSYNFSIILPALL